MAGPEVLLVSAMSRGDYLSQSPRRRAAGDLGIRYLAAWLRAHGIPTDILPDHLNTLTELAGRLVSAPDLRLVGISLHTATLESGFAAIDACRRLRPDVRVAIGGYHPTFAASALLAAKVEVDYIFRGEGEQSLLDLVRAIRSGAEESGIPGVLCAKAIDGASRDISRGGRVPLPDLPLPLRTHADMPSDTAEVMVSASRGCYGNCTFCSVPGFGRGWRGRSPDDIADEVSLLEREFGALFIDFVDDSLFGPRGAAQRAVELRDAFTARGVVSSFRASIRPNDVTPEIISALRDSGLVAVQLGVESFSPRQLELYRKRTTPTVALGAIRVLESAGIHVQAGLILFEPSTTLDDLRTNAATLIEEGWAVVKGSTSSLFAAQGTALADRLCARGASTGLDRYLNHLWTFERTEVACVHEALIQFEATHAGLGERLVDAITPPNPESTPAATSELRAIQNQYQRLSFRALALACDLAEGGCEGAQILDALTCQFDEEVDHLGDRAARLLPTGPSKENACPAQR